MISADENAIQHGRLKNVEEDAIGFGYAVDNTVRQSLCSVRAWEILLRWRVAVDGMDSIFDRDFRDILFSEFVSVVGGLATGTVIATQEDLLLAIPGILIIFPGFLEMRGNISGSLSSRIAAGLYLDEVHPGEWTSRIVRGNLLGSFLLVLVVSFMLGFLAFSFTAVVFDRVVPDLLIIPIIAGLIANLVEVPLTLAVTYALFRRGHDPNNVIGPFVTSTGDVTSILALILAVILV